MGKRAASTPASPPKGKVARKFQDAIEVEDCFLDQCAPLFELISQTSGLSAACRDMLLAMSPHCLRSAKDHRHAYQTTMVEVLCKVVAGVELEHTTALQAAGAEVTEVDSQKKAAASAVVASQEAADSAVQERDLKDAACKSATQAATEDHAVLAAAEKSVVTLDLERAEIETGKTEHADLIAGTWAALKAGAIPGQKWRERAKLIAGVVETLEKIGLEASLQSGLPVALKAKPGERGKFAEHAIDFAEAILVKHVAALDQKLGGMEAEAGNRAKAVADAEAALTAATQNQSGSESALIEAESLVSAKNKEMTATQKAERAMEPKFKQVSASLEQAKGNLQGVQVLAAKFALLCEECHAKKTLAQEASPPALQPEAPLSPKAEVAVSISEGQMAEAGA